MIVRLVQMTFRTEEIERFQALFDGWRHLIITFPGCRSLELLHDIRRPGIFFTRSEWDSPADLEAYRNSTVFADVWPVVKLLFAEPAKAWSTESEYRMSATTPESQTPA